jgi:hypothetical protein
LRCEIRVPHVEIHRREEDTAQKGVGADLRVAFSAIRADLSRR